MKNVTVVMGDTHYGFAYDVFPRKKDRLKITEEATKTVAAYIDDNHEEIDQIIHMGDLTEKLTKTPQYDPYLATEQMTPLAEVLKKREIPFVLLAGNTDAYYEPNVQHELGRSTSFVSHRPVRMALRSLMQDKWDHIPLELPGLSYEHNDIYYTHGHWLDEMNKRNKGLVRQIRENFFSPELLEYLSASETDHQISGRVYEIGSWGINLLPSSVRRLCDAILEMRLKYKQSHALGKQIPDRRAVVAGHIHAPDILQMKQRTYLNPGSLTASCKLDIAKPKCTFATIREETGCTDFRLLQCKGDNTKEIKWVPQAKKH